MRLLLIRHGETDWNVTLQYQGHAPIPLNEQGRRQAHRVADRLARRGDATALYASDIARAWETAAIISAAVGLSPQPIPELREIDVGQWEGLTPDELHQRYPDHMREYEQDPAHTVRLGGESYAQMQSRVLAGIQRLQETHHLDETVLAVSHGGAIRTLICHVLNLDLHYFGRMWLDNGSITELRYTTKYGWRLIRLNDAAHLEGKMVEGGE